MKRKISIGQSFTQKYDIHAISFLLMNIINIDEIEVSVHVATIAKRRYICIHDPFVVLVIL